MFSFSDGLSCTFDDVTSRLKMEIGTLGYRQLFGGKKRDEGDKIYSGTPRGDAV